jgi:nucleoside-diphosphate-sugar epimerase
MTVALVTGASGFIGRALAASLVAYGQEVYSVTGGNGNVPPGIPIYRGLYGISPDDLPKKIDVCYHLAALNDTRGEDAGAYDRINVADTMRLMDQVISRGCPQFVYASSTAVYGDAPAPYVEGVTPVGTCNLYGQSKLNMERAVQQVAENHGINAVGLRLCNTYGPGESHKGLRASMVHQLLKTKLRGETPKLFEDGSQQRDWLHVDDAVQAFHRAGFHQMSDIFNIGSGVATSFRDLAIMIFGNDWEVEWIPNPYGRNYQAFTLCNISKARQKMAYKPIRRLKENLPVYLEWLTQHG